MNSKQHNTLKSVLGNPVSSGIRWTDIESLLLALGATIEEAQGSRIAVNLKGV
jgi:hypothetical protein